MHSWGKPHLIYWFLYNVGLDMLEFCFKLLYLCSWHCGFIFLLCFLSGMVSEKCRPLELAGNYFLFLRFLVSICVEFVLFLLKWYWNLPVKPSEPSIFFVVRSFLQIEFIYVPSSRLFWLSISSWVSFSSLCLSRKFKKLVKLSVLFGIVLPNIHSLSFQYS